MTATARYSDLDGRPVFITGGATGIGSDMVRAFRAQGAAVTFVDIDETAGRALAAETGADFHHCDVTETTALIAAVEAAAPDVLVNNAANDTRHDWDAVSPADWEAIVAVNLRHQFFAAQAAARLMRPRGRGSIINFASVAPLMGIPKLSVYSTCKAAVGGMTRSLARELGPYGIRVNAIVPGAILTPRQLRLWITPEDEARLMSLQCIPKRLQGTDVAAMALFLASDVSAGCTAQDFTVDAGIT
jgi:NAD(P)-dependent dehydrogenase (short-subunit alcohol dehydrogenase family)